MSWTARAPRFGCPFEVVAWIPVQTTSVNQPVMVPSLPDSWWPVKWKPTQPTTWYWAFEPFPTTTS